ncbi:hypothetical protein FKM82_020087 [Ascaphus truei]
MPRPLHALNCSLLSLMLCPLIKALSPPCFTGSPGCPPHFAGRRDLRRSLVTQLQVKHSLPSPRSPWIRVLEPMKPRPCDPLIPLWHHKRRSFLRPYQRIPPYQRIKVLDLTRWTCVFNFAPESA